MKKIINTSIFVVFLSVLLIACKKEDNNATSMATIEITIVNVGFSSWKVVSVTNSSNTAVLETNNTPFTFEKNRRYKIVSMAAPTIHPIEFRDALNNVLISQSEGSIGNLESNVSINFVREANGISFTTSSSFTSAVSTYNCANHNGMRGNVVVW
jgi:hypothetical protein